MGCHFFFYFLGEKSPARVTKVASCYFEPCVFKGLISIFYIKNTNKIGHVISGIVPV